MLDAAQLNISIHALLAESDRPGQTVRRRTADFYPRSPCGERRRVLLAILDDQHDFYPRSPCGERPQVAAYLNSSLLFLSTLSLRRATCVRCVQPHSDRNFYPRSPCGERRQKKPA